MQQITSFRGAYGFLSNMHDCRIITDLNGQTLWFNNVEAAYQAHKCPEHAEEYVGLSGVEAKWLSKRLPRRSDWESVNLAVMEKLLRLKFSLPELRGKLLATGEAEIIEGNTWHDTFWGVCYGVGENHLGRLLMKIRGELRAEQNTTRRPAAAIKTEDML